MNLTKNKVKYFYDSLIVLLNISNSYSIIPYILFFQYYRGINSVIIFAINLIYLFFRFRGKIKFEKKNILFTLFIIINVVNYLFSLLTNTFGIGTVPFLFVNITFYIILINLFHDYIKTHTFDRSIWLVLRGYVWFSLIGLFSIVVLFVLINVFSVNPLVNNIGSSMDLFASNLKNPNTYYYFPFNISTFIETNDIRLPFFQSKGIILGIFHEPHTATFLLTSSLFVLLYFLKSRTKKIILISLFTLFFLTQASTTNILSLLIVAIVFNFNKYKRNIIILIILIISAVIAFFMINPEIYQFIVLRINSGSASYSLEVLKYPFNPKSLLGSNFYDLSYIETYWNSADKSKDIGYIMFFLNLIFLFFFISKIVGNILTIKDKKLLAIVPLYFLLHSTKVGMYSFTLSYLILMIFIIHILSKTKEKNDTKVV